MSNGRKGKPPAKAFRSASFNRRETGSLPANGAVKRIAARSLKGRISLNNNRNNRRRGRGNRNTGGGNQLNRIDSRARGNAPQLLDKYKKLAQDAQHNGDRVQAEYYLQFADHYFRVIADNKARQDEVRSKRGDERGQANDDSDEHDDDDRSNRRSGNRRPRNRRDDGDDRRDGDFGEDAEQHSGRDDFEEAAQPKRRARKPRAETSDKANGDAKPRRRKVRGDDNDTSSGEIDSSVLPPAIGADTRPDKDGDDGLKAVG